MTCPKCNDTGVIDLGDKVIVCRACNKYWMALLELGKEDERHDRK